MTLVETGAPGLLEALGIALRGVRVGRRTRPADTEAWLTEWLYQHHFTGWDGERGPDLGGEPGLVGALEAATGGHRYFAEGWKVRGRAGGGFTVFDGRVQLFVPAKKGALRPPKPRAGQRVAVSFPCARNGWLPGYFGLVSRAGEGRAGEVKLYLNLTPEGAPRWVRFLMEEPVLRRSRFEAKVFNHPRAYGRRDSAVMYLEAASAPRIFGALKRFVAHHPKLVRAEHVPFTLPLGRGLSAGASLRLERESAQSYGELRCRLAARAALQGLRAGAAPEAWGPYLARAFAAAGTDLLRPWEGPARIDWASAAASS